MKRLLSYVLAAIIATGSFSIDLALSASEKRTALVIGNGAYQDFPLRNPSNDAKDLAQVLKELGFSVTIRIDANQRSMGEAIHQFGKSLSSGGVGLFYYAGHGVQVNGVNYLIPIDAEIRDETDVRYESVDAGRILSKMEHAGNRLNIIILDACRNNPFKTKFRSINRGLAKMDAPTGSILAYSTAPGSVAADGQGRNGLYTSKLLKYIKQEDLSIESCFKKVRIEVMKASGNIQVPWESSSLTVDFFFAPLQATHQLPIEIDPKATNDQSAEFLFWESVKDSNDIKMYKEYVRVFPNGTFARLAEIKIKHLSENSAGSRVALSNIPEKPVGTGTEPTTPRMKLAIFPWKPVDNYWNIIVMDAIEEALRKTKGFIPLISFYEMDPAFGVKTVSGADLLSFGGATHLDQFWDTSMENEWTPNSDLVIKIANHLGVDAIVMCSVNLSESASPKGNVSMFLIDVWRGDTHKVNEFIARFDEEGLDRSIQLGKALLGRNSHPKSK